MIRYFPTRLHEAALAVLALTALSASLSSLAGCVSRQSASGNSEQSPAAAPDTGSGAPPASLYLQLVEGLHVTGTPVPVDIETFRLKVSGLVERELSLSFDEVRALAPVREEFSLECPGFFLDRGVWTGVPLGEILDRAGPLPKASRVVFTSLSQGYTSVLSLADCRQAGVLVAYEFNGKLFPEVHGYPLRLTAKDHPGSVWVKWLGEIQVLE